MKDKKVTVIYIEDTKVHQKLFEILFNNLDVIVVDDLEMDDVLDPPEKGMDADFIVLDAKLKQAYGPEIAKSIREANYSGVIIALTANILSDEEKKLFDLVIEKPVNKHKKILDKIFSGKHE